MTEISSNIFHETSQKIFTLVKQLDNSTHSRKLEDQVWEAFCQSTNENVPKEVVRKPRKTFRRHPKNLDTDSSLESPDYDENDDKALPIIDLHYNKLMNNDTPPSSSESSLSEKIIFHQQKYLAAKRPQTMEINNNYEKEQEVRKKPLTAIEEKEKDVPKPRKKVIRHTKIKTSCDGKIQKKSLVNPHPLVLDVTSGNEGDKCNINKLKQKPKEKQTQNLESNVKDYNIDKKLKSSIEKILSCIDSIRMLVETGVSPPDGAEDLARRKKRAVEFSARFSRIYLYQISRQITELHKLMKPQSGRNSGRQVNLHQKLLTTHQIILQAFQAYHHHMPSSIAIGVPEKLKELINQTTNLCQVHRTIVNSSAEPDSKNENIIKSMESQCKTLHDKIQECSELTSSASLLQSNTSKLTLLGYNIPKRTNLFHKQSLNSRLSMYSNSGKKDPYWKKAVATLAYKKFNVPSRYKTSMYKHRPPVVKPILMEVPSKHRFFDKKSSSTTLRNIRMKPLNDDKISTLVENVDQMGSQFSLREPELLENNPDIKNDLLKPVVRNLFLQFCEENKDMTQAEFETILRKLLDMVQNDNEIKDAIVGGEKLSENIQHTIVSKLDEHISKKTKNKKQKRRQTITESGEKNARLICIKDEDSVIEENEFDQTHVEPKTITCTEVQTEHNNVYAENVVHNIEQFGSDCTSRTSIKISRLPKKSFRNLAVLPKDYALKVIQYKLEYNKFTKGNPMYKKSSNIQPWVLTGQIGDKMLEHLLLSVTREIEINEILETLYQSEFQ